MARSNISSTSHDLFSDDGGILVSMVQGEQLHLTVRLGWITNLSGYTVTCKVLEGEASAVGSKPTSVKEGGVITTVPILDSNPNDNEFILVFEEDLIDNWALQPVPGSAVYGYIGMEVRDPLSGNNQQIWKPLRGLVEVKFSPTEVV